MCGIEAIEADHFGAARAFEMGMLMCVRIDVGTETPYPVVACYFMCQAFFTQPFKHAVERNPVYLKLAKQTLFNFMVRDGPLFSQQHGKRLNSARCHPVTGAPDYFFCLFLEITNHKTRLLQQSCIYYNRMISCVQQYLLLTSQFCKK